MLINPAQKAETLVSGGFSEFVRPNHNFFLEIYRYNQKVIFQQKVEFNFSKYSALISVVVWYIGREFI